MKVTKSFWGRLISLLLGVTLLSACRLDPLWTEGNIINKEEKEFSGTLSIFMDASVSMKGFVTVDSSSFNRDVPIVLSSLRGNLANKSGEEYYLVVDWTDKISPTPEGYDAFKKQVIDPTGKSYTGQTTQIYSIINQIANKLKPGDVGVFITDGVLSEGYKKIHDSKKDNTYYFGDLQREVKEALDVVFNKGLCMAIIRTTANYDGNYYTACNEEKVKAFMGHTMRDRPYYYFLFGKEDDIPKVLNALMLKDISKYKTTFYSMNPSHLDYSLAMTAQNAGINSIEYPWICDTLENTSQLDIHISLKGFDNDETPEVCLCLPRLTFGHMVKLDDRILCDNSRYFEASPISKADCMEKVNQYKQCSDEYWDGVGLCYLLKFKKSENIRNAIDDKKECILSLVYENKLLDGDYSIGNDLNKTLKEMEGRTFGFAQFIEAIEFSKFNSNFINQYSEAAIIKFNIIID